LKKTFEEFVHREREEKATGQQNKVQIRVILPFLDQGSSGEAIVREPFKKNIGVRISNLILVK